MCLILALPCPLQVERIKDEGVLLRILQTALTLMQDPAYADDEVGGPGWGAGGLGDGWVVWGLSGGVQQTLRAGR